MRPSTLSPGSWLGAAATAFDRAVFVAANRHHGRSLPGIGGLGHDERLAAFAGVREAYGGGRFVDEPGGFFAPPGEIAPSLERVRREGAVEVFDASWPSEYEPYLASQRGPYLAHERNRVAWARVWLGPRPRPAVVLVHGYLGGHWAVEERAFPVRQMTRAGYDVAIAALPFHGPRASSAIVPPPFPGNDPAVLNEGMRQVVHDVRGLMRWLEARGAPSVGLMGQSLGGMSAALVSTLEAKVGFAVLMIPLASFADLALEQGRLGAGERAAEQYRALAEAVAVCTPARRPSLVPPERVLVLAGLYDGITPPTHAERLAAHFGVPVTHFAGGHVLPFGRTEALASINRFWSRLGLPHGRTSP